MKPMRGKAWLFRGVLDVDWEICVFDISHELQAKGMYTPEEIGKYCMTKVDPDFPKKVQKGDFIVGEFMGFGHDHDHACLSILGAGVAAAAACGLKACIACATSTRVGAGARGGLSVGR